MIYQATVSPSNMLCNYYTMCGQYMYIHGEKLIQERYPGNIVQN